MEELFKRFSMLVTLVRFNQCEISYLYSDNTWRPINWSYLRDMQLKDIFDGLLEDKFHNGSFSI